MKRFILLTALLCIALLAACGTPAAEPPAPHQLTEEIPITYEMVIDTAGINVRAAWPDGRPGTICLYDSQPLQQLATAYIEAYGQAWLAASAAYPNDGLAIENCKLVSPPLVTYISPADSIHFTFVGSVEHAFEPRHYQYYTCTGGTRPFDEEEGWLVTAFFWRFQVGEDGQISTRPGSTDGAYLFDGYIPIGLIREAQKIYDQFELDTVYLADNSGVQVAYQDNIYTPCRFATYAELEEYLRQYFSTEITATLLDNPYLAEIEGRLHVIWASRGGHIGYQGERWYLTEASANNFVYTVEVDYLFPWESEENLWTESFQFVLEYEEGRGWVFTRFDYYL